MDERNEDDSGECIVPPSFIERRPLVTRGESWEFDSFLDSAVGVDTPRVVDVGFVSRGLFLFLPYYTKWND
jgi:hypothetical protein